MSAMFDGERSMYDDDRHQLHSSNSRENLKLPLLSGPVARHPATTAVDPQLLSPLALTTPDLESFITASTLVLSTSCTTPTPTHILKPGIATLEQEEYAKGFVDALLRIRQQENGPDDRNTNTTTTTFSALANRPTSHAAALPTTQTVRATTNNTSLPTVHTTRPTAAASHCRMAPVVNATDSVPFSMPSSAPSNVGSLRLSLPNYNPQFNDKVMSNTNPFEPVTAQYPPVDQRLALLTEQLQIVPGTPPPPSNPLDPDLQEELKRRRKKERNRVAASKCRKRRLEKEAVLEDRVKAMKQENGQLQAEVNKLRQVVFKLKQLVLAHVNGGCKVMKEQAGLDNRS
ncbi:transcription factor Jun-like [Corticium candelabrum]|uniref:transcription factor Jun-like n=1 Tax=Corticium candelabrum TaxID=121492 RepID=UPI002E2697B5|nr:transcription factor Jun-like [Corticium candelabrum]